MQEAAEAILMPGRAIQADADCLPLGGVLSLSSSFLAILRSGVLDFSDRWLGDLGAGAAWLRMR